MVYAAGAMIFGLALSNFQCKSLTKSKPLTQNSAARMAMTFGDGEPAIHGKAAHLYQPMDAPPTHVGTTPTLMSQLNEHMSQLEEQEFPAHPGRALMRRIGKPWMNPAEVRSELNPNHVIKIPSPTVTPSLNRAFSQGDTTDILEKIDQLKDATEILIEVFLPEQELKGVTIITTGFGENHDLLNYKDLVQILKDKGRAIMLARLRDQKPNGQRGHVGKHSLQVEIDLKKTLDAAERLFPGQQIELIAHSTSGAIALKAKVNGIIPSEIPTKLIAPLLGLNERRPPDPKMVALGGLANLLSSRVVFPWPQPDGTSVDITCGTFFLLASFNEIKSQIEAIKPEQRKQLGKHIKFYLGTQDFVVNSATIKMVAHLLESELIEKPGSHTPFKARNRKEVQMQRALDFNHALVND